jgi:hypothetical protein
MRVIAGGDGSDGCLDVKIVAYVSSFAAGRASAGPAPGRGFVEQERATHAIVVTDAIQQRLDLLDCCVRRPAGAQHAPDLGCNSYQELTARLSRVSAKAFPLLARR